MNNRYSKKIRKEMNKKIVGDYENLISTLQQEKFIWRSIFALRIVFNWNPSGIKFKVKNSN